jgi:hypothetical protein
LIPSLTDSERAELQAQVQAALATHGSWRARLEVIVALGSTTLDPDDVAAADRCPIGQWLARDICSALRNSPFYGQSLALHAEFHRQAAELVRLTKSGKRAEAFASLHNDGAFGGALEQLRGCLDEWSALSQRT